MRKLLIHIAAVITFLIVSISANAFTLSSHDFLNTGTMPTLNTCDGKNLSPQLSWTDVPPNTQTLAIIVRDPDAPSGTLYHWIIYNIPTTINSIPAAANSFPAGVMTGKNDFGKMQYNGPCPPAGSRHTYIITVYALDSKLVLPPSADAQMVLNAIQSHIIDKAELTAVYGR